MTLSIRHQTSYTYAPGANRVGLRLKLFPQSTPAQIVEGWEVTVNGEAISPMLSNPFGEGEAMWFSSSPVERIEVEANGRLALTDTLGVLGKLGRARPGVFRRETALTAADDALKDLAASIEGATPLDQMHALTASVHEGISYRKGATESSTTAAQTLALGAGVCQDLSHVFIASARLMGLPARYVTGYLLEEGDPEDLATHAWAEVFLEGLGWTGFDPTHAVCPSDRHVRLCSGFDAADAAPIRGHVTGDSEEDMDVVVEISALPSQSQTQS